MSSKNSLWLVVTFCLFLAACGSDTEIASEVQEVTGSVDISEAIAQPEQPPNLLIILTDDLGYTDLGVYGGEIDTPNLDQLARQGLILTDFHNQAVCGPTRAALLSGTDNRNAGGAMHQTPNQQGVQGYESELNEHVAPFPVTLQIGGYNTYMAGKWHLGTEPHQTPNARGFDRSFALRQGGASHYSDGRGMFEWDRVAFYYEDGEHVPVDQLPEDFYSSDFYTDYIIDSIDADAEQDKPWFAYLAFTAPHWPLQAPDELIAKYQGVYDEGFEVVRAQRIARAKELGVIPEEAQMYPRLQISDSWDSYSEEEKRISSKKMEIYAAMIDSIDQNVGRLIDYLKQTGEYDNTLIVFMADNGAEGAIRDPRDNGTDWTFDNSYENMGRVGSHIYYGDEWAQVSVGVNRYYKSSAAQGGIHAPAFIHHPNMSKQGVISDAFVSIIDIAPTFLELAGLEHPEYGYNGRPVEPIQGESLVPLIFEDAESVRPDDFVFGWEIFGHRAIRQGDWKLTWLTSEPAELAQPLAEGADQWALFDLSVDPGETNDLSAEYPGKVEELLLAWDNYVAENGIVLPVRATN